MPVKKIRDLLSSIEEVAENTTDAFQLSYYHVLGTGIGILLFSYLAIYLVDIRNSLGLRSTVQNQLVPVLWHYLFKERGPIELVQWLFLGAFATTCGYLYHRLRKMGKSDKARFWLLFAIAGVLMLIEDALNPRHFILRDLLLHQINWTTLNLLETAYFGAIAAIPAFAVIKYGRKTLENRTTAILVAGGFLFYGTAVFISGPADLTDINQQIGDTLYEATISMGGGEELRALYEQGDQNIERLEEERGVGMMDVRYMLKDFLVEESLELLGATFLLASAVSYLQFTYRKRQPDRVQKKNQ